MEAFVASILRLDASDLKQDTVSRMIAARGTGQNFSEYMKNLDKALITNEEREAQAGDGLALLRAFQSNFNTL